MTALGESGDSFIVEENGVYYVVETVRKYAPGQTGPDGYPEIVETFKNAKPKLKAVRVRYDIRAQFSAHSRD